MAKEIRKGKGIGKENWNFWHLFMKIMETRRK